MVLLGTNLKTWTAPDAGLAGLFGLAGFCVSPIPAIFRLLISGPGPTASQVGVVIAGTSRASRASTSRTTRLRRIVRGTRANSRRIQERVAMGNLLSERGET